MELVRGVDLPSHVGADGAIALPRISRSFAAAHRGTAGVALGRRLIHRDLKPSDVLVQQDGRVVLLDFGVALAGAGARCLGHGALHGTQQRRGRTGAASDLFALGVMLELALAQQHGALSAHDRELQRLHALGQELRQADPQARPDAPSVLRILQGRRVLPMTPRCLS